MHSQSDDDQQSQLNLVSSSDHLIPEMPELAPNAPAETTPPVAINPGAEDPPWSGLDLLIIGLIFVVALFFFSMVFLAAAVKGGRGAGISASELGKNQSPLVIVPTMTLAYAAMLAAMYVLVTRYRRRPFWPVVGWRWPEATWQVGCLAGGGVLAIGLGMVSKLLPIPKSLPMDQFFRDAQGAYLMAFFGVAVAPLAEEMLFRGFLYPVLDRWLQTLFMVRQQVLRGGLWILLLAAWGALEHKLPVTRSLLLALLALLAAGAVFLIRSVLRGGVLTQAGLLPGVSFFVWGLASGALSHRGSIITTGVLLAIGLVLTTLGLAAKLSPGAASWAGRFLAVAVTAMTFALVHSEQLGRAWAPLLVLFVVGLVLTITRAVTRSVVPGFLIHVGYNLTLFLSLYVLTDHFRHLERITE
jgi:membrane protease YdiL (CAAX protease family)